MFTFHPSGLHPDKFDLLATRSKQISSQPSRNWNGYWYANKTSYETSINHSIVRECVNSMLRFLLKQIMPVRETSVTFWGFRSIFDDNETVCMRIFADKVLINITTCHYWLAKFEASWVFILSITIRTTKANISKITPLVDKPKIWQDNIKTSLVKISRLIVST